MNVNSLSSQEIYQQYFIGSIVAGGGTTGMIGGADGGKYMPRDTMEISASGQFMSGLRSEFGNSDAGHEIQAFFKQAITSIRGGDFDATAAAEAAPEELKAFAEEAGVDLTEILTSLESEIEAKGNNRLTGPPPPPPPPGISAGENIEELQSFFDSIEAAVKDGSFDPAAFAESVPESLEDFAETMGIRIEDLLQEIGSRIAAKSGISQD